MLQIIDLHAEIDGKKILNGINLEVNAGEIHAIMGPNGSGKSTLSAVIAGNTNYKVTKGEIYYFGKNILEMSVADRANAGIFLGFQYPVEIPGVSMNKFLYQAINSKRKYQGLEALSVEEFRDVLEKTKALVEMKSDLTGRFVNVGFSGGEKKRNEIFQMAILRPLLSILDETDSGLDIDALRIVSNGVNKLKTKENACVLITHYQRLLDFIVPDFIHILYNGKIIKSAGKELALELEKKGYNWIIEQEK